MAAGNLFHTVFIERGKCFLSGVAETEPHRKPFRNSMRPRLELA
ncbi:hypothetical protein CES86_2370 [Brucella lupini]|uniref:Uncharacterized protein n=1 Tax=Brucella lupini TaxID=255457 RepID=A0A256GRJ3_9HYPH|nr:hypothetical protein CES86_2370 [Brucella lupini]